MAVGEETTKEEKWPVEDQDGFYQAYKEKGRWINWWGRNRPGMGAAFKFLTRSPDNSNIPSNQADIDRDLPNKQPYWLRLGSGSTNGGDAKPEQGNKDRLFSAPVGSAGIRATWLGHATVLAEVDSAVVITDPIFSQRASVSQWFGPKRYTQPACKIDELPENLNAVVISHNHYDHLDYNSVSELYKRYKNRLHWFVPQDMGSWFTSNFGISKANVHELTWWQEANLPGTDVNFVLTPSNHWGRRGLFDENKALWGSWAVIGPKNRFWFGGDTAYSDVFKQIGKKFGPFNLAAIPIGAFEPRWFMKHVHVNPMEAVKIHQDIQSHQSLGIHWGTFKLTYEPYTSPRSDTRRESELAGLNTEEFMVVNLGETVQGKRGQEIPLITDSASESKQ